VDRRSGFDVFQRSERGAAELTILRQESETGTSSLHFEEDHKCLFESSHCFSLASNGEALARLVASAECPWTWMDTSPKSDRA
jgi:hypothetical protein